MQKIKVIVLLVLLHAQPVANGLVDFLLNQEYIKEFLCVNKGKPKLACKGKCYLMQRLKETQDEKEQDSPILILVEFDFIWTHCQKEPFDNVHFKKEEAAFIRYENRYVFFFEKNIFHPPIV